MGSLSGSEYRWPGPKGSGSGRWGTSVPGTYLREGDAGPPVFLEGPLGETPGSPTVSMPLQRMAQQAKRSPERVFNYVFHVMEREFLRDADRQSRKRSAPAMDQRTAQQAADHLADDLRDRHERWRAKR